MKISQAFGLILTLIIVDFGQNVNGLIIPTTTVGKFCYPQDRIYCPRGDWNTRCQAEWIIGDKVIYVCQENPAIPRPPENCTSDFQCGPNQKCWNEIGITKYRKGQCLLDLQAVPHCTDDDQCRVDERCVASGLPEYGRCASKYELNPFGAYCKSTSDCQWYMLETCTDEGECVRPRWASG